MMLAVMNQTELSSSSSPQIMMQAVMNRTELSSSSSPQIMMQAATNQTELSSSSVGPTLGCYSILRVNIPNRIE